MIKIFSITDVEKVSSTPIRQFLIERIRQIYSGNTWDVDSEGYMLVVESCDNIQNDYAFVGSHGLLSDTFDENSLGDDDFASPFEFIAHHQAYQCYELYLQCNDEVGLVFVLPEPVVSQHPALQQLLTILRVSTVSEKRL